MSSFTRSGVTWVAASLLACASCGLLTPALQSPVQSGVVWREVTSEHFVLYTDLASDEARRRMQEFETLRDALVKVAFDMGNGGEPRVWIVLFDRDADFEAFAPFGVAGYTSPSLGLDLERHAALVLPARAGDPGRRTFVHEEVHELMHRALGNSPVWLNEGMAEYFSTLSFENGDVFVGQAVPERTKIPESLVPSAAQVVSAGRASFLPEESDSLTAARFYAGAWLLVHFFHNGPDPYRLRFDSFVGALGDGQSPDEAWRTAMAGVAEETLEWEFRKHIRSASWLVHGEKIAALPPLNLTERRMAAAEVHLLWARLAATKDRALATREVDDAAALDPTSPEVAYARGCLAMEAKEPAVAAEAFRAAAAGAPDPRFLFGVAVATGDCGASPKAPEDMRLCESLIASARSPEENTLAALYLRRTGHEADALRRAKAAVQADLRCALCAATLAEMLAANGNVAGAIAVLERATSTSVETPLDRKLAAQLEKYRMMQPAR
jgi:hypothetical protein